MTDHNKERALHLVQLEEDLLMSLRKTQYARDKRIPLRWYGRSFGFLGLFTVACGIAVGPPHVHVFTAIAFICAFFSGRGVGTYKKYGALIEANKKAQDSMVKQIRIQREITDLTCVPDKITTVINDVRAHARAVMLDLSGGG